MYFLFSIIYFYAYLRACQIIKSGTLASQSFSAGFDMKIVATVITLISGIIIGNGQIAVSFLDPDCGVSISGSTTTGARVSPRILNGATADMFGNPWMALISSLSGTCGGSLITNRKYFNSSNKRKQNI